ncbi:MAG: sigma-70 family RNA polymerase sigma factor [Chryseobacterium sp.]|nr:MAG: sigma-70 family RNA polymerase sigma factor [Chryseobacterium sp.]
MINHTKQELLDKFDWSKAIIQLAAYAISLNQWTGNRLPKGLEPEDLVMQAIEKVYSGARDWNPGQDEDLLKYFKSVIKSIFSNETKSKDAEVGYIDDLGNDFDVGAQNNYDEELYCRQLDSSVISSIRADPDLLLVYKGLKDGLSPADIEQEYGLPIKEIRNSQKRLHRKVLSTINILAKEQNYEGSQK